MPTATLWQEKFAVELYVFPETRRRRSQDLLERCLAGSISCSGSARTAKEEGEFRLWVLQRRSRLRQSRTSPLFSLTSANSSRVTDLLLWTWQMDSGRILALCSISTAHR